MLTNLQLKNEILKFMQFSSPLFQISQEIFKCLLQSSLFMIINQCFLGHLV